MPPIHSKRFVRHAKAERDTLIREHRKLTALRDRQQAQADATTREIESVEASLALLAQVVGDATFATIAPEPVDRPVPAPDPSLHSLRGAAVRIVAVRLLMARPEPHAPIHYSDWYAMLAPNGYSVSGKDGRAVFLTQVRYSPAIRKADEPGVYYLDDNPRPRVEQRLADAQDALRSFTTTSTAPTITAERTAARRRVVSAIARAERDLAELNELYPVAPLVALRAA